MRRDITEYQHSLNQGDKYAREAERLVSEVLDETSHDSRLMRHEIIESAHVHATLAHAYYHRAVATRSKGLP